MARPLRSFCLHRIKSGGGAAASSTAAPPSICAATAKDATNSSANSSTKSLKNDDKEEDDEEAKKKKVIGDEAAGAAVVVGRKVMVASDGGSEETRTALQWALSHAVRPCDTVVLLDVVRGSAGGGSKNRRDASRGCQHLEAMRSICQAKRPEVRVEVLVVEGKERGPAIVEAARKQGASLLVVGQKRRSVTWRLLSMWMAGSGGVKGGAAVGCAADYCVQHAACMALAVRRKSRRGGGYLITTRRQKDFWLLA